jgi:hypothetical protein
MGQPIDITRTVVGDVLLLDGDRSITGQDGTAYASAEAAVGDERFPGRLAGALFDADAAIDHIFVASNQVVMRRRGGWDDDAAAAAAEIVSGFFVFYT